MGEKQHLFRYVAAYNIGNRMTKITGPIPQQLWNQNPFWLVVRECNHMKIGIYYVQIRETGGIKLHSKSLTQLGTLRDCNI